MWSIMTAFAVLVPWLLCGFLYLENQKTAHQKEVTRLYDQLWRCHNVYRSK